MKPSRIVFFVLVCLLGSTLFASAAPASSNDGSSTRKVASFDVQQHGQRFWRRVARTARPLAPEVARPQSGAARVPATADEVGVPYSVPSQTPGASVAPELKRSTSALLRERVPSGRAAALPDPIPFNLSEIINVTTYPYVTHGKIFGEMLVDGSRQRFVCSGTIVSSQNQSTVATAGHCVYDPDEDVGVSAISFAPGYRNKVAPFGFWEAEKVYTTPRWMQSGDHRYDAAMLVIDQGNRPDPIQEAFGSRGISFNRSPLQMFDAYGYPASGNFFDGEKLWMCDSAQSVPDDNYPSTPVPPLGMGCDMTGGSSGGGWVIQADGDEFVNSVMSFSYEKVPEVSFGPYFGTTVEAMYAEASTFEGGNEIVHAATMTLKLVKHLKAKVTVESEFPGCAAGRAVDIYKLIDKNTGKFVKTGITNQAGAVTIKLRDKKGTYFADAEEVLVDAENICETAQSFAKKHKH